MLKDASIYTLPSRYSDEDDQSLNPISIPRLLRRLLISIHKRHTHRITYWGYKQYVLVPHYKRTLSWVQTCDILACHSYVNVTVSLTRCWCGWYLFVTRSSTVTGLPYLKPKKLPNIKLRYECERRRVVSWTEPTKKKFFFKDDWYHPIDQNTPTLPFLSVIHQSALNDTRHCGYGHGEKSSHRSRVRTSPDNSSWHSLRSSTFSVRIRSDITQTYFTACYSHKLRPTFRN